MSENHQVSSRDAKGRLKAPHEKEDLEGYTEIHVLFRGYPFFMCKLSLWLKQKSFFTKI